MGISRAFPVALLLLLLLLLLVSLCSVTAEIERAAAGTKYAEHQSVHIVVNTVG
jgi:hypothetical protein